jgi:hypothetical protein
MAEVNSIEGADREIATFKVEIGEVSDVLHGKA